MFSRMFSLNHSKSPFSLISDVMSDDNCMAGGKIQPLSSVPRNESDYDMGGENDSSLFQRRVNMTSLFPRAAFIKRRVKQTARKNEREESLIIYAKANI